MLLLSLLFNLRSQGLKIGLGEWLSFLKGLEAGLVEDLRGLYGLARATLIHDQANYDAFDVAFTATFQGVELPPKLKEALSDWLAEAKAATPEQVGQHGMTPEELMREFYKRMQEQKERHDGGNYWIGTGGTSPFGNGGRADAGIRVGGESAGGRGAVALAQERRWASYRTDLTLDVRDFEVALAMLRRLAREGEEVLDMDGTIDKTCKNGGDIELDMRPEKNNRIKVALFMDVGGSMDPHAALVSRLFSAASRMKTFKKFESWYFHNCPYLWMYKSYQTMERKKTLEVLNALTPDYRLIWVGDASMAPWELFTAGGYFSQPTPAGIDMVKAFAAKFRHRIWLNPDPERFWDHPTVRAIGAEIPMFPLSLKGMREGIRRLRGAG